MTFEEYINQRKGKGIGLCEICSNFRICERNEELEPAGCDYYSNSDFDND